MNRRAPSPHPSPPLGERDGVRGKPWFSGSMCEALLGRILTPALSHRMGEGESCPARLRIQPPWILQTMGLAVPSPVGRERVRVRANFD
jgi:hypothetical protein